MLATSNRGPWSSLTWITPIVRYEDPAREGAILPRRVDSGKIRVVPSSEFPDIEIGDMDRVVRYAAMERLGNARASPPPPSQTAIAFLDVVLNDPDPAPDMIRPLLTGAPQEINELFAVYAQRLSRVAEQYLSNKLAARIDGEDVVQSAFRTFFRRSEAGEFQIDSSAQLWRLLVKITVLKARAKARHHTAGSRDVSAEKGGDAWLTNIAAREPSLVEAAMLVDLIETLLQGLPPLFCDVLQLRLEGHGPTEIAARLKVSRMTVHRTLKLLQRRAQELDPEDF